MPTFTLPHQYQQAKDYLEQVKEEKKQVTFEIPKRSNQQSRTFHDNVEILANASGYSPHEMKLIVKQGITNTGKLEMVKTLFTKKGIEVKDYRSTRDLDTKEFGILMDYVFQLGHALNLQMHDPDLITYAKDLFQ